MAGRRKTHIKVDVSDLAETGDDVRCGWFWWKKVAYKSSNKVASHHHVVRGFVGEGGPMAWR